MLYALRLLLLASSVCAFHISSSTLAVPSSTLAVQRTRAISMDVNKFRDVEECVTSASGAAEIEDCSVITEAEPPPVVDNDFVPDLTNA